MPLRDHFRGPLADLISWEELHSLWPGLMVLRLNAILPPEYRSGARVHVGTAIEVDVATFEHESPVESGNGASGGVAVAWAPAAPALLLETEEPTPPEYEVRVYDVSHAPRLVATVEIVGPRNKDRPESRDAFVSKCHALLQQEVCVAIVDPVTERSANLYADLADRLGAMPPAIANAPIYAVSCRGIAARRRWRVEAWQHELALGAPLPTLPLWLNEARYVPLELEATYEATCRGLRIP